MHASPRRIQAGFTLVEMAIVATLISILAAFAIPAYKDSVDRSHRSGARQSLMSAAQWMERHYSSNNTYCASATNCGTDPLPESLKAVPASGARAYTITVTTPSATQYLLTATPVSTGPMRSDTRCNALTLDHRGVQAVTGTAAANTCWRK
jgi:type IV pilus assembly protein PilE